MLKNLLVNVEDLQMRGDTLDAVWLVYLTVYILETPIKGFKLGTVLFARPIFKQSNILFPMKQRP